jgi:hypothetical protein
MKNENLAGQIARTFYPYLVPGSLLIHQDFKHFYTSWIHLLQYQLRRFFRFYQSVPNSSTAAFELITPVPKDVLERATEFARVSDHEIDAAFRYSMDLVGANDCTNVAAAHVTHYVHLGRKGPASRILEMYRSLGMSARGEFPDAIRYLEKSERS